MTEYTVTWTIQLSADNPRAAAELAQEYQRDPNAEVGCLTAYQVLETTYHYNKPFNRAFITTHMYPFRYGTTDLRVRFSAWRGDKCGVAG